MNQLLIGLWGPVGVGKDSVADALGFPKISFAATLKSDLKPILDRLGIDLNDREHKERVRPLLVSLGATARSIDPNHWIKRVTIPPVGPATFADVRYWNEILAIVFRGGIVYELVRPGFEPANEEEHRSFKEIRDNLAAIGVSIPQIVNTTPKQAAEAIRMDLYERVLQIREASVSPE